MTDSYFITSYLYRGLKNDSAWLNADKVVYATAFYFRSAQCRENYFEERRRIHGKNAGSPVRSGKKVTNELRIKIVEIRRCKNVTANNCAIFEFASFKKSLSDQDFVIN